MLSIGNMAAGQGDYYLGLASGDYYLYGGEPAGRWLGQGAAKLDLVGQVAADALRSLLEGKSADGRNLIQTPARGEHQPGWDLTFSAPKSVSVVWAVADAATQQTIQACQAAAVEAAIGYLEDAAAFTRRGKGGAIREPVGLVVASFEHGSSRARDPQLHTHCLVANVAARQDGTTGTIVSQTLYQHKMAAGALYRAELAHQLQSRLGLAIERQKNLFELSGVPAKLVDTFSKRRHAILKQLEATGFHSPEAAAVAARVTRDEKEHRSRAELFAEWKQIGKQHRFTDQSVERLRVGVKHNNPSQELATCWSQAVQEIMASQSHFTERDAMRRVAELAAGRGFGSQVLVDAVRNELRTSDSLVRFENQQGEPRYTTQEMLDIERRMLHSVRKLSANQQHTVSTQNLDKVTKARPTITPEQLRAVEHLTRHSGSVAVVSGMAGTGKTYLLDACREAWERQGYQVHGAALAGKAAKGLEEGAGIKSTTIAAKLHDLEKGFGDTLKHRAQQLERAARDKTTYREERFTITPKTILVIDEAGMVGTRQLAKLVEAVEQGGGKLVLVGDAKQLQPVEAGGAFSSVGRRVGQAELAHITRQKEDWAREAVHQFARGDAATALKSFAERDLLSVSNSRHEAMQKLVLDWKRDGLAAPKENLILTGTNHEAATINQQCQEARLQEPYHHVRFSAQVGPTEIHEGDRVLFTKNSRQHRVCNGDLATVQRIDESGKTMLAKLDRGDTVLVPLKDYQHIQLGYAVTTHKAQGMTVDNAFVLLGGPMQDREITYVQASRARGTTRLYATANYVGGKLAELVQQMEKSRAKDLALDHIDNLPASGPDCRKDTAARHAKDEQRQRKGERRTPTKSTEMDRSKRSTSDQVSPPADRLNDPMRHEEVERLRQQNDPRTQDRS
ncbi:MAG: MobF family relaxase [Pirellulales bacterium]